MGGPQRRRRDQRVAAVRCGGDRLRAGADRVRGNPRGEAAGAFVVAAAGNAVSGKGERRALFPGAAPGVFAVGATTEHGCLAIYSSFAIARTCSRPGRTAAAGRRAPGLRGRSAARAAAELRLLPGLRVGLGSLQHPPRPRNLDVGRAHERGRGPGSRQRRSWSRSGAEAPRRAAHLHRPPRSDAALLRAGVARRPARDRPGAALRTALGRRAARYVVRTMNTPQGA